MSDIFNMADTWNDAGTVFTAIKMNVTDTASAAGSLLMDLQIGSASYAKISAAGAGFFGPTAGQVRVSDGAAGLISHYAGATRRGYIYISPTSFTLANENNDQNLELSTTGSLSSFKFSTAGAAVYLRAASNNILHSGEPNGPVPVAQTLGTQGSRAGTDSDVAGANLTVRSGIGTGNAAGSSLIFQTPLAVASGTGAQTSTTRLALGPVVADLAEPLQLTEQTAPAAGAANTVRVYAVDNGAGKTQLMALFASGAAQQLAIEP